MTPVRRVSSSILLVAVAVALVMIASIAASVSAGSSGTGAPIGAAAARSPKPHPTHAPKPHASPSPTASPSLPPTEPPSPSPTPACIGPAPSPSPNPTSWPGAGGTLDGTFGSGGVVVGGEPATLALGGLVRLPSGGIVVVGTVGSGTPEAPYAFGLAGYTVDGTVDSSFGTAGRTTTVLGDGSMSLALAATLDTEGRILVAGSASVGGASELALARYLADGTLDPSFGTSGVVLALAPSGSGVLDGIAVQCDASIVVSGKDLGTSQWLIARFLPDGSLDSSFGSSGFVLPGLTADGGYAIAIGSDGAIIASQGTQIVRLDSAGALDPTFGAGGVVPLGEGAPLSFVAALGITSTGQVIAAGDVEGTPTRTFGLIRLDSAGALDPSFGSGGLTTTDLGGHSDSVIWALTIDDLGRLVTAGQADSEIATARFDANGNLDSSFGGSGWATLAFGSPSYPTAIAIAPDGRITIAGGINSIFPAGPVEVARYLP